jgi:nucleoside-diphosphate-sugar epimerase
LPAREEEMAHNPVNINRLRALTGWQPSSDVALGIRRALTRLGWGVGPSPQSD